MNIPRPNFLIKNLIGAFILAIFQGCVPISFRPSAPPIGPKELADIVSVFQEQDSRVHSFISYGGVTLKALFYEFQAGILIAATRDPLKIKIEVTHPWGGPLLYVLIQGTRLDMLSFPEKRYYMGHLGKSSPLSDIFPVRLGPHQIWALLRGYPALESFDRAVSLKGDQISLLNSKGEGMEIIDLYPDSNLPRMTLYPEQDIRVTFSDFENDDGIYYARKIGLYDPKARATLELASKTVIFNKAIPDSVFDMAIPSDFAVFPMNESGDE